MSHSHTVDVGTPMNITATFDVEYELKTAAGAGGTVTPATGWYIRGSSVQLHANPSAGYAFDRWEGTFAGKDNPMTVEMNRAVDETAYFTQTSSVGDGEAPAAFELRSASPNPCTAAATIVFTLPGREAVSLLVTDLLGRVVITAVDNVEHAAGTHMFALNVSALPSGIYLLQLRGGGDVRTRRMLVLR